ncbi:MAG: D-alanine--D-alanine ligase [Leptospira sp.]|nr:D-alanine--D-alanine ligase [Leptospira sp.]
MSLKKVSLFFGGVSSEHEISIRSSYFIFQTISKLGFAVVPIYIDPNGKFWMPETEECQFPDPNEFPITEFLSRFHTVNKTSSEGFFQKFINAKFESCVLGLHGGQGENGSIQGFLEVLGIPYTGSGVLASGLAMDKYRSNLLFENAGIPVAPFLEIQRDVDDVIKTIENLHFSFPVFIKPTLGGSSVNTGSAKTAEEAIRFIHKIFESDARVLVQEMVKGTEVSIGVIERLKAGRIEVTPLVPTEILPKTEFFDYEAKYKKGGSEEITPARLSSELTAKLQSYAILCHNTLGCRGYSRTDFIIREGVPFVLETNTLPGMTGTSLIPQQAKALGISMEDVFRSLVEISLFSFSGKEIHHH